MRATATRRTKRKNPNQGTLAFATPLQRLESKTGRKYAADTANGLTAAVIDSIELFGGAAWRMNCIGEVLLRYETDKQGKTKLTAAGHKKIDSDKTIVKKNPNKGISDIIAIIQGQFVGVEIKVGRDWQKPEQEQFQQAVEDAGGIYIIVRTFDEFYKWIVERTHPTLAD